MPPLPEEKKIVCINCGTILADDTKFCSECGASTVLNPTLEEAKMLMREHSSKPAPSAPVEQEKMHPLAKFIGIFILCSIFFAYCKPDLSNETPEQAQQRIQEDAFYSACQFVEKALKNPKSAKFCSYREAIVSPGPNNEYAVGGWVDSMNSFGATVRTTWSITIRLDGTTWRHVYGPVFAH